MNKLSTSTFEQHRLKFSPKLPSILQALKTIEIVEGKSFAPHRNEKALQSLFPHTWQQPILHFSRGQEKTCSPLRLGTFFSGGQAPGGHNVLLGLFDALKQWHPGSQLFGFLGGPSGLIEGHYQELTESGLAEFRNSGGFDRLGSGRTKIETPDQLLASLNHVESLNLDGLVVIGGDDSNTNAAVLAEYYLSKECGVKVIGVPKTIDGDLKNKWVETSFGFDTACKIYSELIGNIARDALSAKKYYHFIKLMGRSASHITLECALQTHPNIALIGEEIAHNSFTLKQIIQLIADVICLRNEKGKNFGVILIPEGLIEFVPEIKALIKELNEGVSNLSSEAKATFSFLPKEFSEKLLLDRDPHGNILVSHIPTEQLLVKLVEEELKRRKVKFNPLTHFFGYEGRAGFPSNFDANYCYALGVASVALIGSGYTGYMSLVNKLTRAVESWEAGGMPLTMMMHMEERKGKQKPVIEKTLVDLNGEPFKLFAQHRQKWALEDQYRYPGPIQYFGPGSLCDEISYTLQLEQQERVSV
ncbi:MAG: diphosphate--fructose-6-phosphate 1-phosphotransferase [Chlamydiales bacterium]